MPMKTKKAAKATSAKSTKKVKKALPPARSAAKKPVATKKVVALQAPKPKAPRSEPILGQDDLQEIVRDLGWQVAPRDVEQLIAGEDQLRLQANALNEPHYALLREQLSLALDILRDHVDGECPQIPLATIAVLAAAVTYYDHTVDVIPDFLPHIGRLDDAAVMAMAFHLGEAGIRRYCDWRGMAMPGQLLSR